MKPVQLMAYPIRNSSMTNGIVLDPFLGSGSTLIACEQIDRACRGIELDPKFVDVIVKRYIEQAGKSDGVYVLRDGQKLTFEEVSADMEGEAETEHSERPEVASEDEIPAP
jgi:site-specific DNA-methyltransferase (adenine-specific)